MYRSSPSSPSPSTTLIKSLAVKEVPIKAPMSLFVSWQMSAMLLARPQSLPGVVSDAFAASTWAVICETANCVSFVEQEYGRVFPVPLCSIGRLYMTTVVCRERSHLGSNVMRSWKPPVMAFSCSTIAAKSSRAASPGPPKFSRTLPFDGGFAAGTFKSSRVSVSVEFGDE
ncbi:hypothetical protein MPH_00082 [Macrophomina phaseolina MS6]|uniref:Uncharacterized protein n=1 Tax=Macrophomina phaseolina (strain MS6) TaxID=1126212 RepID=K2SJM6_MACPH|nr:hypothetical protein MPH_00082 [Macrophomina phaseolina MS6]